MQSLQTLIMVLTPMFIGFAIRLPKPYLPALDRILNVLVYLILLLIGISLAQEDDVLRQIDDIAVYVAVLFTLLMAANIAALTVFERLRPWRQTVAAERSTQKIGLLGGLKQLAVVISGCLLGMMLPEKLLPQHSAGTYALMALIFVVGIQLRSSGIGLRQVLLNDLLREFFALACIPLLMRRYPAAAVGIGGATSMDFTLPVIRQSGGLAVVPLAVCFGFVVNLAAPILMMLFAAI